MLAHRRRSVSYELCAFGNAAKRPQPYARRPSAGAVRLMGDSRANDVIAPLAADARQEDRATAVPGTKVGTVSEAVPTSWQPDETSCHPLRIPLQEVLNAQPIVLS